MDLLALPYQPNHAEFLALSHSGRILGDQMAFLKMAVFIEQSLAYGWAYRRFAITASIGARFKYETLLSRNAVSCCTRLMFI